MKYDIEIVLTGTDKRCRLRRVPVLVSGTAEDRVVVLRLPADVEGEGALSFRLNDLLSGMKLPADSEGAAILAAAERTRFDEAAAEAEDIFRRRDLGRWKQ